MENFNENYDLLFNSRVEIKEPESSVSEYKPSPEKGKGGTYKSIIRFIPWYKDPVHGSIQEKWTCWLVDPLTQKGKYVDCPSSIGKPSPLQDMYWKLKKSDSVAMQKKADIFSRRHNYASLIQVIKDENAPELEGKIIPWRFGSKIFEKINAELKPIIGESDDPFNILTGKAFAIYVIKKGDWPNYDSCKFLETHRIPLLIPDEKTGKLEPITAATDKAKVFNFVKENSADLTKFSFLEWDQTTHEYVNTVIASVTGKAAESATYASIKNGDPNPVNTVKPTSGIVSQDINLDELDNFESNFPEIQMPSLDTFKSKSPSKGIAGSLNEALDGL